jgi:hypothetical protein
MIRNNYRVNNLFVLKLLLDCTHYSGHKLTISVKIINEYKIDY